MASDISNQINKANSIIYNPGEIIFAHGNGAAPNCFGVIVEKNFWDEQVKIENVLGESLETIKDYPNENVHFRVLGTKIFRQYWKTNNEEEFEPNDLTIMKYRFNAKIYTSKVDLKPLINSLKIKTKNMASIENIFEFKDPYAQEVLHEARIIYEYLEEKRFKKEEFSYINQEAKLLRLLERAIPL
jgi:hypothetical protein